MTKRPLMSIDTPPEFWEKAFEEPEPEKFWWYQICIPREKVHAYRELVGGWSECCLDDSSATHRGVEIAILLDGTFVRAYCEGMEGADSPKGVRVMARDEHGWFALKEYPV